MTQPSAPRTSESAPGYFGPYGGRFVAETLVAALDELTAAIGSILHTAAFQTELRDLLTSYVGRPTPLTRASRLAAALDPEGTLFEAIYLKREDLCHTGAHKINNAIGQVLLAKKMGKKRVIAETGAGQHGVATATACALFDIPCEVYMGAEDVLRQIQRKQEPNHGQTRVSTATISGFSRNSVARPHPKQPSI